MSVVEIRTDPVEEGTGGSIPAAMLIDIARDLLPSDQGASIPPVHSDEIGVTVEVHIISEAQSERFVNRLIALSASTGRAFTIIVTLDEPAQRKQIEKYPDHILGDGHIVHVRPDEGSTLHGFFRYLFAAP
jgi:hypothetical protein